ncbi:fungal-specific transcription factor domain-containing protein [Coniochaeta sp. 2T2.1]|nr:fungal-specific transcription factor domain-containing protein [Coniochaeta sp. 2T2.1]
MDVDLPPPPRQGNGAKRSSNGCWTCRLRRKKCDQKQPICDTCSTLLITCHNGQEKPEWMDGGARQEEMAEQLKREVKEKAHFRLRRWERAVQYQNEERPPAETNNGTNTLTAARSNGSSQHGNDCTLLPQDGTRSVAFERSNTVLLMFYLDNVLPFLFPFYRPSPLNGGKSWILELVISSPVLRQATLSQSSYFFSVARHTVSCQIIWETMLEQSKETFAVLGQSLQVINASNTTEHLHGSVRILTAIMQLQRFEIAVLSLENCRSHLTAALALFAQVLASGSGGIEQAGPAERFSNVMDRLGPSTWTLPNGCEQFPSAEQSAFRFASALLIFDDIIASTVLQEPPTLYEYHDSLLGATDTGVEPLVNLEAVIGCHNCVMRLVGEIAVLDAWKQACIKAGSLNMMELVRRATIIQEALEKYLTLLANQPQPTTDEDLNLLDIFRSGYWQRSKSTSPSNQSNLVTRIWSHAAQIYLFVVVSGWQPASREVGPHVGRILELLETEISPPAMLRTVAWPFCVAGCLAMANQEPQFRGLVNALQPPSVFGTLRKALDIMEEVWRNRSPADAMSRDVSSCFKSVGDLVLLV